ncbi:unnamed protein product [Pedinophyceae sp. YPF-701]|nr:unnamed protein product [Pedinophyceae sp. YPF-701]
MHRRRSARPRHTRNRVQDVFLSALDPSRGSFRGQKGQGAHAARTARGPWSFGRALLLAMSSDFIASLRPGDWIRLRCTKKKGFFAFQHHGIVTEVPAPDARRILVVHFTTPPGESKDAPQRIVETTLAEFLRGGSLPEVLRDKERAFSPEDVVRRARSCVGRRAQQSNDADETKEEEEKAYDLIGRNCEHFCSYVYSGEACSEQVHSFGDGLLRAGGWTTLVNPLLGGILALGGAILKAESKKSWHA